MKPIFGLNFGNFPIYYAMLIIAGLVSFLYLHSILKRPGAFSPFMRGRVQRSFIIGAMAGVAGSNVVNWFITSGLQNASLYERITQGGFSFFFGVFLFFGVYALALRLYKTDVPFFVELAVRPVLLAQLLVRLGCSLHGCCWGKDISLFGHSFPFPAREMEILFAAVLLVVFYKRLFGKRLLIYMFAYPAFRFGVDFMRGDDTGTLFGVTTLSPVQIVSVLILLGVSTYLLIKTIRTMSHSAAAPKKRYTPLPHTYIEPFGKKHPARTVIGVLAGLTAVFLLFVFLNPFHIAFLDNIRLSIRQGFSFLYTVKGEEDIIGGADGISLQHVDGTAATAEEALRILQENSAFEGIGFACAETAALEDGGSVYVFYQTISGMPVLGRGKVLVTDANNNVSYIAGDDAALTYTDETVAFGEKNGAAGVSLGPVRVSPVPLAFTGETPAAAALSTVKEMFPGKTELSRESVWYDTGNGLINAYQAILTDDGVTPVLGVVAEAATDEVITFTPAVRGAAPDFFRSGVLSAGEEVLDLISAGNTDEIDRIAKKNDRVSDVELERYAIKRALCMGIKNGDIPLAQMERILTSANRVAQAAPSLNANLYREIVADQIEKGMKNDGASAEDASAAARAMQKAFSSCGIDRHTDEQATRIEAGDKPASFKHSVDYTNDKDIFEVVTRAGCATEIEIQTATPVTASFYSAGHRAIVSEYIEKKETLTFYPEDGDVIRLQITDQTNSIGTRTSAASYTVTVRSKEESEEIPAFVLTTLTRICDAYERSNITSFLSMVADVDGSIISPEDAIGYGLLAPVVDSCSGCMGLENGMDTAKTVIAASLLPEGALPEDQLMLLKGTTLELECLRCLPRGEGYAVRARIAVTMGNMDLYRGYTLLQFDHITTENKSADEALSSLENILSYFRDLTYRITEINSAELYQLFGSAAGTGDLPSLYDLWIPAPQQGTRFSTTLVAPDETRLANSGLSSEKIESFRKYTARHNLLSLKQERAMYKMQQELYIAVSTLGQSGQIIYDAYTNPIVFLLDLLFERNETADRIWSEFKFIADPIGEGTGYVLDALFEGLTQAAEELTPVIEELDRFIGVYEAQI